MPAIGSVRPDVAHRPTHVPITASLHTSSSRVFEEAQLFDTAVIIYPHNAPASTPSANWIGLGIVIFFPIDPLLICTLEVEKRNRNETLYPNHYPPFFPHLCRLDLFDNRAPRCDHGSCAS